MKLLEFLSSYFLILLMAVAALTVGILVAAGVLDLNRVIVAVENRRGLALLILLGLFLLKGVSVCIPLVVICAGASLIFGAGWGTVISLVGTALCISESYLIGRFSKNLSLTDVIEKHPKFGRYFANAKKFGFTTCFISHCFQWSTEVQGVIFGLMRTKYSAYLLSSMLVLTPSVLVYVFIGDAMNFRSPLFLVCAGLVVVEIIVGLVLGKRNIIDGGKA